LGAGRPRNREVRFEYKSSRRHPCHPLDSSSFSPPHFFKIFYWDQNITVLLCQLEKKIMLRIRAPTLPLLASGDVMSLFAEVATTPMNLISPIGSVLHAIDLHHTNL
jgi:hypothetical protein